MRFDNKLPIYAQIVNYIKGKIISKEYDVGEKLPSVRELSSQLKVNPNTIQRSYGELELEGLVYTKRGMGTFVIEDEKIIIDERTNMAEELVDEFLDSMGVLGISHKEIVNLIQKNRGDKDE